MSRVAEEPIQTEARGRAPGGRRGPGEVVEAAGEVVEPEETVEGLPVLADVRPIETTSAQALPAVQAAAAAATGFVAGAAAVALVRRRAARRFSRAQGLDLRRPGPALPAAGGGRTFLVHVRVLGRPDG